MNKDSRILLLSAGIDSFCSWYILNKPSCIHVTGHSRYSNQELETVIRLKEQHPEMELRIIYGQEWLQEFEEENANIDARNLLFVDIAAHYGDTIYLVCQRGEMSIPDRSPEFFEKMNELLTFLYGKHKRVWPVFVNETKADLVQKYLQKGFPVEELLQTYSCFSGERGRCGRCAACARTAWALDFNSILPDNFFNQDIWEWSGWNDYIRRIKNNEIEERRASQTKELLVRRGIWK